MKNIDMTPQLNPNKLEMASQTRIWRVWHAVTPLPLEDIKAGFLDSCRGNGLLAVDRVEVVSADAICTLLIDEIGPYGIGFSILEPQPRMKSFAAASRPKSMKEKPVKAKPEPAPEPQRVTPTEDELARGWTKENLTEYLTEDGSIHSQQYQK